MKQEAGFFIELLSLHFPFTISMLVKYQEILDWELLSINENIKLSFDEFVSFADKWDFGAGSEEYPIEINYNPALPWSLNLLKHFEDNWQWESISQNHHIPWDTEIIREFKDKLYFEHLSGMPNIEWTEDLIAEHQDKWDWKALAQNPSIIENEQLVNSFPELKKAVKDEKSRARVDSSVFDFVENTPEFYSEAYLEENKDNLDWEYVSAFGKFELSEHILDKFSDYFVWGDRIPQEDGSYSIQPGLSWNTEVRWTEEIIDRHTDDIDWDQFSHNTSLPWELSFIEKYWSRWNQNNLIFNIAVWEKVFKPCLVQGKVKSYLSDYSKEVK